MEKRCTLDNGSLWLKDRPCKIYVGQWPIVHGLLILPYIIVRLKLFLYIKKWPGVFVPLRALALVKLIKVLKPSKALGPDELHHRVLKLATELVSVFAHLFQQSIDTGEIPKEWSLANICPLFKKSDRSLACNYRPVSLTCVPCKLLEHIVCSNIMAHLDGYKLLSDRQHAFKKRHSCETQLTAVINYWAKILDNRGQVDPFILDFEKAFDTPPHELLISKLFSYGIGGKTLKWIDSFLWFGQQRVVVNGVKSEWAPVLSGVPQGTVLGPLLFSLYINDISSYIESEIRPFADNCVAVVKLRMKKTQ